MSSKNVQEITKLEKSQQSELRKQRLRQDSDMGPVCGEWENHEWLGVSLGETGGGEGEPTASTS
jgi:hypothetical protein